MRRSVFTIILVFIVSGISIFCSNRTVIASRAKTHIDADAIGTDEDENARYNYELMRLRDPATGKIPNIRAQELAYVATLPHSYDYIGSALSRSGSALAWQERGPWNVGGRTRALAIDVSNENILIAGSASGGMWRSTDQGASWAKTTNDTQALGVTCVSQDKRTGHQNTWYFGTGEADGASASATGAYFLGSGIYKSTDGGLTWAVLPSTTSSATTSFDVWGDIIWNVVTNPADAVNDVVYAAAYGGIYRSINGGTTWTLVLGSFGGADAYYTDVAITSTGVVYATLSSDGSQRGLFRSADGLTFANITPDSFPTTYNRIKIGISPSDESQVMFLANTPGAGTPDTNFLGQVEWNSMWKYKYISGDGTGTGGMAINKSAFLPATGGLFDKFTCQGSYDLVVKFKPNDTNTIFIGGTNLYRSTSGFSDVSHTTYIGGYQQGATLPVVNLYTNHHPDQHELIFLPSNPNKMFSSNDGGIFRTDDNTVSAVSWTSLDNGYLTSMFYTCAIDHATTSNIIIGGAQDNGSWFTNSTSLTAPWVTPRGGDGSYCAIADSSSAYYFSIQSGKMMRAKLSSSGTLDSFARIDPIGGFGYLFINPYVLDPNNNNVMYLAAGTHLWRNDNLSGIPYASNWDSISTNWVRFPDSVTLAGAEIASVAVSKNPANRVYFGTSLMRLYRVDNANVGTPTPVNITSTTFSALFPSGGNISCIAIDPNNADNILVVFSNYNVYSLYSSTDGGATYTKVAGNLEYHSNANGSGPGPSLRWAQIIPVSDGYVYLVGTSAGLFGTTQLNGLATVWTQLGSNTIGNAVVDMIDYRATDGLVTIATHTHGIFSSTITQVADVNGVKQLVVNPAELDLNTYPNPFKDNCTVQFTLLTPANVILNVFDVSGRLVQVLHQGMLGAGAQKFIFNGAAYGPGMYLCSLNANGVVVSKRMVMVP